MLDRIISLVLLAVSGGGLFNAIKLAGAADGVRGAIFPLVVTGGLALLSISLLVSTFGPTTAGPVKAAPTTTGSSAVSPEQTRRSFLFFGLIILYVIAVKPLGFLVASTAAGTAVLRFTFRESWWQAFLISAAVAVLGWLLFKQLLLVPLPSGELLKGVFGG